MKLNAGFIANGVKVVSKFAKQHSPTICIAIGVGMMAASVITTIVEAPKAKDEIDILDENEDITPKAYIKEKTIIIVKHYWPIVIMTVGGSILIFCGHKISLGRTAAALAAYQMSKDDLKRLEDKIVEMDGEKHLEKAKDEIARDRITSCDNDIIQTGKGDILFMDSITGQRFRSNFDAIDRAVNNLNAEIHNDSELTASLNTWLDLIGCKNSEIGDKLGWRFSVTGQNVNVKYRCIKDDDTSEVTHLIEYTVVPIWDFDIIESSDRHNGYTW